MWSSVSSCDMGVIRGVTVANTQSECETRITAYVMCLEQQSV